MHSLKSKPRVTHFHYSKVNISSIWSFHDFFGLFLIFFFFPEEMDVWEGRQRRMGWLFPFSVQESLTSVSHLSPLSLSDFLSPHLLLISLFLVSLCQLFILGSLFSSSSQSLFSLCFSVSLSLLFLPLTFDFCLTLPSFLIIVFHFNRL